jgi:putative tryptophan/tyrosine transport system substrate-binding protein
VRRREFLGVSAGTLITCSPGFAQSDKQHRVGFLLQTPRAIKAVRSTLLPELEKQDFVEGKNLTIDVRAGPAEVLPRLARELLAKHPHALVTTGGAALLSASSATATVPIVTFGANPVDLGVSQSMSRPATNVTGVVILARELDAKRLELLQEAFPNARRLAAMVNPRAPAVADTRREMTLVAERAGKELVIVEATGRDDYAKALTSIEAAGATALAIAADPTFNNDASHLAQLAIAAGLPTVCQWREMAEDGCLLSYGPSYRGMWVLTGRFVGTILRGSSARDLPVEQPTIFELVVNAATAKALGIIVPPSLLARADEVIE